MVQVLVVAGRHSQMVAHDSKAAKSLNHPGILPASVSRCDWAIMLVQLGRSSCRAPLSKAYGSLPWASPRQRSSRVRRLPRIEGPSA